MIHGSEPGEVSGVPANSNRAQLDAGSFAEQLSDRTNGARGIAPSGKMPEHPALAGFEATLVCGFHKASDRFLVGRSKKEGFIVLPAAREFGLASPHSGIVGDFPWAHVMESGDTDATFLRNFIQGVANFLVRLSLRDAEVTSVAHRARDFDVEVAVRKKYPAAGLRDEWMVVLQFPAQRLDLRTRPIRDEDQGDMAPLKLGQGFFCLGKRIRTSIDECTFQCRKNQLTRGKQDRKECNAA